MFLDICSVLMTSWVMHISHYQTNIKQAWTSCHIQQSHHSNHYQHNLLSSVCVLRIVWKMTTSQFLWFCLIWMDVLQSFLICSRALKSSFHNYSVKSSISYSQITNITLPNKYIKYCIVDIKDVAELNQLVELAKSIRKLTFGDDFNQPLAFGTIPYS